MFFTYLLQRLNIFEKHDGEERRVELPKYIDSH